MYAFVITKPHAPLESRCLGNSRQHDLRHVPERHTCNLQAVDGSRLDVNMSKVSDNSKKPYLGPFVDWIHVLFTDVKFVRYIAFPDIISKISNVFFQTPEVYIKKTKLKLAFSAPSL